MTKDFAVTVSLGPSRKDVVIANSVEYWILSKGSCHRNPAKRMKPLQMKRHNKSEVRVASWLGVKESYPWTL